MNREIDILQWIELLYLALGSRYDLKEKKIPAVLFVVFGAAAVLCNLLWEYQSIKEMIFGGAVGAAFLLLGWMTKEGIGYGDGLGILVLGIFEGFCGVLPIILVSLFLSGVFGLWKIIVFHAGKSDELPFFPFLLLAYAGGMVL